MEMNEAEFKLESENIEVDMFIKAINRKYGYDFQEYSFIHLKRRALYLLSLTNIESISTLSYKMLYDRDFFESLVLPSFSVNVTEMFRDPHFYEMLRSKVIPELKKKSFVKIWHAGCSTGEEVYSMAILLKEAGMDEKTQIYATDFNEKVLDRARKGILPIEELKNYTKNYQKSGGVKSFSKYYTVDREVASISKELLNNVVFASHNLVSDGVFGEMDLIVCRNVMIYFTKPLQNRVIRLFSESIADDGFLCLGTKEKIRDDENYGFELIFNDERIYRINR